MECDTIMLESKYVYVTFQGKAFRQILTSVQAKYQQWLLAVIVALSLKTYLPEDKQ